MSSKKTEIRLSRKNITALIFAIETVKKFFGKNIITVHSTIRKVNNSHDNYEIEISVTIPKDSWEFGKLPKNIDFTAIISFTLGCDASQQPVPSGGVQLHFTAGMEEFCTEVLYFRYDDGDLLHTPATSRHLWEMSTRMSRKKFELKS